MEELTEEQQSLEDAKFAVEIFKKALEYRPIIQEAIVGQAFLDRTTPSATLTPREYLLTQMPEISLISGAIKGDLHTGPNLLSSISAIKSPILASNAFRATFASV